MAARSTGKYWLYGSLIVGFLLFVSLVLFFKDESLNPAAKADLEYQATYSKPEKNAYYALVGLMAAKEMSSWQAGWKVKTLYDAHIKEGKETIQFSTGKIAWLQEMTVSGATQLACQYQEEDHCHADLFKPGRDLQKLISDNHQLLTRYEQLFGYPLVEETMPVFYPLGMLEIHQLLLAKTTLLWQTGDKEQALKLLTAAYTFWRKVLRSDVGIVSKMHALAILKTTLRYYANLIANDKTYFGKTAANAIFLTPFDSKDFDFYMPIRREYKANAEYFIGFGYDHSGKYKFTERIVEHVVVYFTIKENATINTLHKNYMRLVKLSRTSPGQFPAAYQQYTETKQASGSMLDALYNPIGKQLLAMAIPAFEDYVIRMHSLEALRRLVALKQGILSAGIPQSAIVDYLQKHRQQRGHLYTGEAAQYDKNKARLFFSIALPSDTRIELTLLKTK